VPCGGGGPSASSPLLNDVPASPRRGDSHPAHRRSQITRKQPGHDTSRVRRGGADPIEAAKGEIESASTFPSAIPAPVSFSSSQLRVGFPHLPRWACPASSAGLRAHWETDDTQGDDESPASLAATSSASSPAAGP